MLAQGKTLAAAARMTEMSEKTARSYRDEDRLPSQRKRVRSCRMRVDPFADVWEEVRQRLPDEPRLKAITLLGWLQSKRLIKPASPFSSCDRMMISRSVRFMISRIDSGWVSQPDVSGSSPERVSVNASS